MQNAITSEICNQLLNSRALCGPERTIIRDIALANALPECICKRICTLTQCAHTLADLDSGSGLKD